MYKYKPPSFVVNISSYSSRILSSRSFSNLSHIIPTCLRENKGCSLLLGDEAAVDVPVRWEINTDWKQKHFGTPSTATQPHYSCTSHLEGVLISVGAQQPPQNTTAHHLTPLGENGLFCTNADAKTQGDMNGTTLVRHLPCWLVFLLKTKTLSNPFPKVHRVPIVCYYLSADLDEPRQEKN